MLGTCISTLVSLCSAQCPPTWVQNTGIGDPGLHNGSGDPFSAGEMAWTSVAWDPDGEGPLPESLVVGGSFSFAGSVPARNVAIWDGSSWAPLGQGLDAPPSVLALGVSALAVHQGELYAGGSFSRSGGRTLRGIARWSGTAWEPLGTGVNGEVLTLLSYGDRLIVGGSFTQAGGNPAPFIAAWDGSWHPLSGVANPGPTGTVYSVVAYEGLSVACREAPYLLSFNGTRWFEHAVPAIPYCLKVLNNELIVGGNFDDVPDFPGPFLARWDGSTWRSLGTELMRDNFGRLGVTTLAVYRSRLYAGGWDYLAGDGPFHGGIARWDGCTWEAIETDNVGTSYGTNADVLTLTPWRDMLFVGGSFSQTGNEVSFDNGAAFVGPGDCLSTLGNVAACSTNGLPASGIPAWRRWSNGVLTNYVCEDLGLDPSRPVIPIFHGWNSAPDAPWVNPLAECLQQRFPTAQIIVADAKNAMEEPFPQWAQALIPGVAMRLADQLRCGATSTLPYQMPLVVGHSFGGAIAAGTLVSLGNKVHAGVLFTIDTPAGNPGWFELPNVDTLLRRVQSQINRHINVYSARRALGGFGSALNPDTFPKVINIKRSPSASDCPGYWLDHTCLVPAESTFLCSEQGIGISANLPIPSDQRRNLIQESPNGPLIPNPFDQSPVPSQLVLANQAIVDAALSGTFPDSTQQLTSSTLGRVSSPAGTIALTSPGTARAGFAAGSLPLTSGDGAIFFEYQATGISQRNQTASFSYNDAVAWTTTLDTPQGEWAKGWIPIDLTAPQPVRVAAMLSKRTGNGTGQFVIRNVTVLPSDLVTSPLCASDLDDGSGTGTRDRAVTIEDLLYFLREFEGGANGADLDNGFAIGLPDGAVTIDDLLFFLARFEAGC